MTAASGMANAAFPAGTAEPGRAAREDAPVPVPPGSSPVAAGLRDQIETWVNEGGAGDDAAP